jgi:WD40 repeat protein/serine/threonine protein kinase
VSVPGHEILGELGRGGMGVVYKARQVQLNRLVALKMVLAGSHAGAADLARFRTDAEALASLQHPNIVQIFEVGEHESRPYFTMEFMAGGSLAARLAGSPQPAGEAARLVGVLARAMHAAHQRGIIHRDLKPANVLLAPKVDIRNPKAEPLDRVRSELGFGLADFEPKVTDFGLAKKLEDHSGQTQTGMVLGTPSYMAPEQAEGRGKTVGPVADVYALGAILYELLTGRPPFRSTTRFDTVMQVLSEEPVPPSRLQSKTPPDLETICLKCLQKEPPKRYATAEALADDLARFERGLPIEARPVGQAERLWRWCRRNPLVASLSAATAVLMVVAFLAVAIGYARTAAALTDAREARDNEAIQKGRYEREAKRARDERDATNALLYLADMRAVYPAWERDDLAELRQLLDRYQPRPGWADPRNWEWHYFQSLCRGQLLSLSASVTDLRWSSDGRRLIAPGMSWDAATGDGLASPRPPGMAVLSPDSRRLAVLNPADRTCVNCLDAATGKEVFTLTTSSPVVFDRFVWSPDGHFLAASVRGSTIRVWDTVAAKKSWELRGHAREVFSLGWSPDSKRLASGSEDGSIRIWDVATRKQLRALDGHKLTILSLQWSGDGRRLASASLDKTVKVWDPAKGAEIATLPCGALEVKSMAWSQDGQHLAFFSFAGPVRLWEARSGKDAVMLPATAGQFTCMAFSPDSERLAAASSGGDITIWQLATGKESHTLGRHRGQVTVLAWSLDGRRLVSAGRGIKLWDATEHKQVRHVLRGHKDSLSSLAWSPGGERLASGDWYGTVKVWQPGQDKELMTLIAASSRTPGNVHRLAWSPDGSRLAVTSADKKVIIWDVKSRKEVLTLTGHTAAVHSVAWSPDGRQLASGSGNGFNAQPAPEVRIHDAVTGNCVRTLVGHTKQVSSVAWSPDSRRLASVGIDGKVIVWEGATGTNLITLDNGDWPGLGTSPGPAVAWSPKGQQLASGSQDGTIRVWDSATWKIARTLHMQARHSPDIVAWSPDGRRLLTGHITKIAFWDTATGQEVGDLGLRADWASWSPDGRRLALVANQEITIWDPLPQTDDNIKRTKR